MNILSPSPIPTEPEAFMVVVVVVWVEFGWLGFLDFIVFLFKKMEIFIY